MRPYIAIIKDAFREAFVSRVLWIVLILLALILLLLFPASYSFSLTTELSSSDITNSKEIIRSLNASIKDGLDDKLEKKAGDDELGQTNVTQELAGLIAEDLREELVESAAKVAKDGESDARSVKRGGEFEKEAKEMREQLKLTIKILNRFILNEDLTKLSSLKVDEISPEARAIFENPNSSRDEIERFNRLIVEHSFETSVRMGPPTSISFYYCGLKFPGKYAIEKDRLIYFIQAIIKYILSFVFSTVGILMALIITANLIPQTFDSGSLSLLLSKPISRWKLYIAQFIGGCAFVTLAVSFFFVGLWLFLGMRMGYWNARLLFYVPSFIGIFAIYYSASAIAGLIWRSPIVSVVAGASLWLVTFVMFVVHNFCAGSFNSVAFKNIDVYQNQKIVAFNPDGRMDIGQWDPNTENWKDISNGGESDLGFLVGPIVDDNTKHVFGIRQHFAMTPVGLQGGKTELMARDMNGKGQGFQVVDAKLNSVKQLFRRSDGRIVVFAAGRLQLLERVFAKNNDDENAQPREDAPVDGDDEPVVENSTAVGVTSLGPAKSIRTGGSDTSFAFNRCTDEFAVLRRGKISIYGPRDDGQYELLRDSMLEEFQNGETRLGFNQNTLLVFHKKLGIMSIDTDSLKVKTKFGSDNRFLPTSLDVSPDGNWIAALTENETVWIYSAEDDSLDKNQNFREIKAICFDDNSHLHLADKWFRIFETDPANSKILTTTAGQLNRFQLVYKFIVYPLYYICPKWGELNYTVEYLVTGKDSADTFLTTFLKLIGMDRIPGIPLATYQLLPWPQVWNSLIFIAVMLGIGCLIIERTDY